MRWDSEDITTMVCAVCLTVAFCVLVTNVRGCVETIENHRIEQRVEAE